uniref:Uncharacterized protein n=1 Tax=Gopherus evgoodei TaxID=1825980 RepID=A0A8C4Y5D6_9SAUR
MQQTPLHLAAENDHSEVVQFFLKHKPELVTSANGSSPLHLAAQHGHTAIVGLLLSKSTSQLHLRDKRGRTCLHLAAANGHVEMVRALLGQGAEINLTDKVQQQITRSLLACWNKPPRSSELPAEKERHHLETD